jgi:hypothetical protein
VIAARSRYDNRPAGARAEPSTERSRTGRVPVEIAWELLLGLYLAFKGFRRTEPMVVAQPA